MSAETGVSPGDRNRAAMQLAERKPSLMALRREEVLAPSLSAERALELSAHIQTLARDMAGPFPFQADYFNEVVRLAERALLDDALAFLAAVDALEDGHDGAVDLWQRAYTWWATGFDKVVRVGRFFAVVPETWPQPVDLALAARGGARDGERASA